jgi:glycosyltransferase involved in cell wall biosynthesis
MNYMKILPTNYSSKNKPSYVVITPVKNEAEYIEKTINSMIQQTHLPKVWVIVNDGSKDQTAEIVQRLSKQHPWIRMVNRTASGPRKRGKAVIEAFNEGYATLEDDYEFIIKLDGDVSFGPDYFENILREFEAQPELGIAGGGLYELPGGKKWVLLTYKDNVRGCTKFYRRKCFEQIGGLVPTMGWDGIDEWKARYLGWKVQSFRTQKLYHYRFTGAVTGKIKSFIEEGEGAYRMGYHPLFLIARGIWHMGKPPYFLGGITMIAAFFWSGILRKEQVVEPQVIRFIQQTQVKKLGGLLLGKSVHD